MHVIPVLDIRQSVVVRGVAGNRAEYRPIESGLAPSGDPVDVACAIRDAFGLSSLYVADLDAILETDPDARAVNLPIYDALRQAGFRLMVDAGIRHPADADAVLAAGATQVIAGLETWPLLSMLEMLNHRIGRDRLVFSLDLKGGEVVRTFRDLPTRDPFEIAAAVIEAGIHELIVLDVASVGVSQGVPTLDLCRELREFAPRTKLITGGGVRNATDLAILRDASIDGVLVASALHDGSLSAGDVSVGC